MDLGISIQKGIGASTREWLRSPLQGSKTYDLRVSLKKQMRNLIESMPGDWVFHSFWDSLGDSLWESLERTQTFFLLDSNNEPG